MAMMRSAFEFTDYRSFLNDRFEQLKKRKKNFSLRYCAKRLGSAHSYLPFILSGKRKIGLTRISNFAELFLMTGPEREYFTLLVLRELVEDSGAASYLDKLLESVRNEHLMQEASLSVPSHEIKPDSIILKFPDQSDSRTIAVDHSDVGHLFRLLSLFATEPAAVIRVDRDALFTHVTDSVETLFGFKPEEMIGRPASDFLHRDDVGELSRLFAESHFSFEPTSTLARQLTKRGDYIRVESRSAPVRDLSGTLSHFIVTWRKPHPR